ncbi:MAG: prolyl oligopeptidase family serine peptidase [Gemmatimonadetes bacterium]|nr:prolyl oligopeptidase family serine peptidase [Gemmatimonadota bacterium]
MRRGGRWVAASLLALSACATPAARTPAAGQLLRDMVDAPSLAGNLLGDPARREALVYLPPGYSTSGRRYPTLYVLHGFDAPLAAFETGRLRIRAVMDSLIAARRAVPMIVVVPDARNAYGGAFYTNSPVAGNWADFVARDLVAHVDRRYRTLPRAAARGIEGHSMGGYGALTLAARHPGVFGAVYAASPCCFGPRMMADLAPHWPAAMAIEDRSHLSAAGFYPRLILGLATALTPSPSRSPLFVDLPVRPGASGALEPAYSRWISQTPSSLVREHAAGFRRLRGIRFDAGTSDAFTHILPNLRELSAALDSAGIRHTFQAYPGDHVSGLAPRFASEVIPFFSRVLDSPL